MREKERGKPNGIEWYIGARKKWSYTRAYMMMARGRQRAEPEAKRDEHMMVMTMCPKCNLSLSASQPDHLPKEHVLLI